MTNKLNEALQAVELSYKDLVEVSNAMTSAKFKAIDDMVAELNSKVNSLPVDTIRDYILQLQLKAYEIAEIKEKAALKAELAEAIQKQKFAEVFNGADGSAAAKDKVAQMAIAEEILTETMYNLVANLYKTKLDQLHRLVDCLKSILMSRMQETKFMNVGYSSEIPATTNGRVNLND